MKGHPLHLGMPFLFYMFNTICYFTYFLPFLIIKPFAEEETS